MADLEANMMHFQLMHESLARFSESFASFLYGLNMNAFCVDFPEVFGTPHNADARVTDHCKGPILESFRRIGNSGGLASKTPQSNQAPSQ